jgi:hypothetical protein
MYRNVHAAIVCVRFFSVLSSSLISVVVGDRENLTQGITKRVRRKIKRLALSTGGIRGFLALLSVNGLLYD